MSCECGEPGYGYPHKTDCPDYQNKTDGEVAEDRDEVISILMTALGAIEDTLNGDSPQPPQATVRWAKAKLKFLGETDELPDDMPDDGLPGPTLVMCSSCGEWIKAGDMEEHSKGEHDGSEHGAICREPVNQSCELCGGPMTECPYCEEMISVYANDAHIMACAEEQGDDEE